MWQTTSQEYAKVYSNLTSYSGKEINNQIGVQDQGLNAVLHDGSSSIYTFTKDAMSIDGAYMEAIDEMNHEDAHSMQLSEDNENELVPVNDCIST